MPRIKITSYDPNQGPPREPLPPELESLYQNPTGFVVDTGGIDAVKLEVATKMVKLWRCRMRDTSWLAAAVMVGDSPDARGFPLVGVDLTLSGSDFRVNAWSWRRRRTRPNDTHVITPEQFDQIYRSHAPCPE